jgi:hypothetical protein
VSWIAPKITRIDEPFAAGERAMLEGFLEWQRATPVWKCAGPSGEQLSERSVPPSTLSLLGLVRHHGDVERTWFRRRFRGEQLPSLFWRADRPDAAFEARRAHVAAYAAGGALTAGFSWYRAFPRDAEGSGEGRIQPGRRAARYWLARRRLARRRLARRRLARRRELQPSAHRSARLKNRPVGSPR